MSDMKYGDFVRAPVGTVQWYEVTGTESRQKLSMLLQSYATRSGAILHRTSINGFTSQQEPVYLLKVEVVKQGSARKKRGRN